MNSCALLCESDVGNAVAIATRVARNKEQRMSKGAVAAHLSGTDGGEVGKTVRRGRLVSFVNVLDHSDAVVTC